jgi:hypothetical protein
MLNRVMSDRSLRLARKAVRHPGRAVLRLMLKARLRRKKINQERARLLRFLSLRFGVDAQRSTTFPDRTDSALRVYSAVRHCTCWCGRVDPKSR